MEIHFQLNYKMPKEVIQAFHITEDTAFETYFENGVLYIRALSEGENQPAFPEECDGNCESCAFSECCPYEKAEPEACSVKSPQFEHDSDDDGDELTEDDLAELDCHADGCENCEYFCRHCRKCVIDH